MARIWSAGCVRVLVIGAEGGWEEGRAFLGIKEYSLCLLGQTRGESSLCVAVGKDVGGVPAVVSC